jgi:hypothetical protein
VLESLEDHTVVTLIGLDVVEDTTRCANENVASPGNFGSLAVLVGAANSNAHLVLWTALQQCGGLVGDLHGQLTGRRDDEGGNGHSRLLVLVDQSLNGGEKESHGLASSRLSLSQHVATPLKQVMYGSGLDRSHVIKLHILCNRLQEDRIDELFLGQIGKLGRISRHRDGQGRLSNSCKGSLGSWKLLILLIAGFKSGSVDSRARSASASGPTTTTAVRPASSPS